MVYTVWNPTSLTKIQKNGRYIFKCERSKNTHYHPCQRLSLSSPTNKSLRKSNLSATQSSKHTHSEGLASFNIQVLIQLLSSPLRLVNDDLAQTSVLAWSTSVIPFQHFYLLLYSCCVFANLYYKKGKGYMLVKVNQSKSMMMLHSHPRQTLI